MTNNSVAAILGIGSALGNMPRNRNHHRLSFVLLTILAVTAIAIAILLNTFQVPAAISQAKPVNLAQNSQVVKIHTYTSPPMDAVNLYWLETDTGIIIVDAGRFLSQARYALEEIRSISNKPIIGILITHPHTDHFGGLPAIAQAAVKDVPIYASQITYDDIETDGQGFIKARKQMLGNDFPASNEIPLPNRIVKDGEKIQIGNVTFQVIELTRNESLVTTMYYLPEQNAIFAGDIVTNKSIPFLIDGNSGNWIAQLQMLLQQYPNSTLYHGHGEPGLAKPLIEELTAYIETLRELVANAIATNSNVTPAEKAEIVTQMQKRYPDYQTSLLVTALLERGIDGISRELKQESA